MDLGLQDKVAVVAGASKGLGRAIAAALAREGAHLALGARNATTLAAAAEDIKAATGARVWTRATDVAIREEAASFVREAASHYGTVHILVTNAGGPPAATIDELEPGHWQAAVELNFLSAVWLATEALRFMRPQKWGRIINLTSVAVKQPIAGLMLSNAVRCAVLGFAKTLANEVAADNILVNNVCPGYILTDRVRDLAATAAAARGVSAAATLSSWEAAIPLGRLGEPEELAAVVAFLASERASYITGTSLLVDGGYCRALT